MRPRSGFHRKSPTLRVISVSTVTTLVAMIAGLGVLAFAVTQYQWSLFTSTISDVRETSEVLGELDRSVIEAAGPMVEVLYRPGKGAQLEESLEKYVEARSAVAEAFDRSERTLADSDGLGELRQARDTWDEVDAVVMASPEEWSNEELLASFEANIDPWIAQVWTPFDRLDVELADARQVTVEEMGARSDEVSDLHSLIGPFMLMVILVAILLAVFAARRMSHKVLEPLAAVGTTARTMHDASGFEPIEVPGAVTEVQDLARIVNETAAALHDHHLLLRNRATTDTMTSLPNRDAFTESLRTMLHGGPEAPVAVLFIDLDDFKYVNDSLGHAAGDELLRVVAQRLIAVTRDCEIVARLGGDEFAVALDLGTEPAAAAAVAERICHALSDSVQIQGHSVAVGCSIGIATAHADEDAYDTDALLRNADFAMYMAKSQGKGRFEVYSAGMHTEMTSRMDLARDLSDALSLDQFVLHFQPMVDLPTTDLLGFEALIRWVHPTRGLVPPDSFISLAEDSGVIVDIGAWVLDQACATLAEQHIHSPELSMSVNVSPRQLIEPDYVASVLRIIELHGIAARHLMLEITEATAMTNTEDAGRALTTLREHGVHVALDDFGTGFSSLQYLGDLPADVIKIDRSFVDSTGAHNDTTLESIVTLAQRLGMRVIAEGIETDEDLARLRRYEHIAGQGFLFARPMTAQDALELVRSGAPAQL